MPTIKQILKLNKENYLYKKESENFFDKVHDKKHGNAEKLDDFILNNHLNNLDNNILDLGCGRGRFLTKLRQLNSKSKLYGIDLSSKMIEKANNENIENCYFEVVDSEKLPYPDSFFDSIYCLNSFHHYPNPENVIQEIKRVLKSDGKLIMGEIYIFSGLREIINFFLPYGKSGDYRMYSKKELNKLFEKENMINEKYNIISPFLFVISYQNKTLL